MTANGMSVRGGAGRPAAGGNRLQEVLAAGKDVSVKRTRETAPVVYQRMSDYEMHERAEARNGVLGQDRRPDQVQMEAYQAELQYRDIHGWMSDFEWMKRVTSALAGVRAGDERSHEWQTEEYRRELQRRRAMDREDGA